MMINLKTATEQELKAEYKALLRIIADLKFDRLNPLLNEGNREAYTEKINHLEDEAAAVMSAYHEKVEVAAEPEVKEISTTTYEESFKAISAFSGDLVEVIGEAVIEVDGKVIEQYLYNIEGYTPENGKPFSAMKANLLKL